MTSCKTCRNFWAALPILVLAFMAILSLATAGVIRAVKHHDWIDPLVLIGLGGVVTAILFGIWLHQAESRHRRAKHADQPLT